MNRDGCLLAVHAPLAGWCVAMDEIPDPVFRDGLLGDGLAIDPTGHVVVAPFDGEIANVPDSGHAVTVRAAGAVDVLVHIGIDTVSLAGAGFTVHVRQGSAVKTGDPLISFDMDSVARRVPSLVTPVVLVDGGHLAVSNRRKPGPVAAGELLFEVRPAASLASGAARARPGDVSPAVPLKVRVTLPHGVHARPAAGIAAAVRGMAATVTLRNAAGRAASASSPVALMSLAIQRHDVVILEGSGTDAAVALEKIAAQIGLPLAAPDNASGDRTTPRNGRAVAPFVGIARGQTAVPGKAAGVAVQFAVPVAELRAAAAGPGAEAAALQAAVADVLHYLDTLADTATGREIAAAHAALVQDPELHELAAEHIAAGLSAPLAWQKAIGAAVQELALVADERVRQRAADLEDIGRRMQRVMAGLGAAASVELPDNSIVLAGDVLPSQLLEMDRTKLAGLCLSQGGVSSHTAILAATFDLPMLVAADAAIAGVVTGTPVLLDADNGRLVVSPTGRETQDFRAQVDAERRQSRADRDTAHLPCTTRDGVPVQVLANLASAADAKTAVENGADGCGLLRTEFLFMERSTPPSIDEQHAAYQAIADELHDRTFVIRLLDAGADKPLAYLPPAREDNPALGVRGVRLLLQHPSLLETQIGAILRTRHAGIVRILVPMVTSVDDVVAVRDVLQREIARAGPACRIEFGAMIETPAAALLADRLAAHVDFFSLGTNDLGQYTLAMDRTAPALAERLDPVHPALLRVIGAAAAGAAGLPLSVCGGAAADPGAAAVLLGLGIRQLSVVPAAVPRIKACIRSWSLEGCAALAGRVTDVDTAGEARKLVEAFISDAAAAGTARQAGS